MIVPDCPDGGPRVAVDDVEDSLGLNFREVNDFKGFLVHVLSGTQQCGSMGSRRNTPQDQLRTKLHRTPTQRSMRLRYASQIFQTALAKECSLSHPGVRRLI